MDAAKHCQNTCLACVCKAEYSFSFQLLLTAWLELEQAPLLKSFHQHILFLSFLDSFYSLSFLNFDHWADSFVFKNNFMASVSPLDFKYFMTFGRRLFLSSVCMYYLYFPKEALLKRVFRLHFFHKSVADRTVSGT